MPQMPEGVLAEPGDNSASLQYKKLNALMAISPETFHNQE